MADIAPSHDERIKNKIFKAVKSGNSTKTHVKRLSNRLGKKQPKRITSTEENSTKTPVLKRLKDRLGKKQPKMITSTKENSTKTPVKRLKDRLGKKQPEMISSNKENFIRDARNSQERAFSPEEPIYADRPKRVPSVIMKPHSSSSVYVDAPMTRPTPIHSRQLHSVSSNRPSRKDQRQPRPYYGHSSSTGMNQRESQAKELQSQLQQDLDELFSTIGKDTSAKMIRKGVAELILKTDAAFNRR